MRYNPEFVTQMKFDENEILTYQLLCLWMDMTKKIVPDYRHVTIPKNLKNIRKSLIWKQIRKFVIENRKRFVGFQFVIFMQAQLQILGKLCKEGVPVLIDASCLCGDNAEKRWCVWKKQVQEANKVTKITYDFVESNLEFDLQNTLTSIKKLCSNEISFCNYEKNSGGLIKYAILKQISPVYVLLSPWLQKMSQQLQKDLADILNTDGYKDFKLENAKKLMTRIFAHEFSMS